MTNKLKSSFECKYCKKSFKKETTIAIHMCEPKRRWRQEKEKGPQIGLMAFVRFYEMNYTTRKNKVTYADLVNSNYYKAFVRFGWHCVELRVIDVSDFINYLILENIKLDWWAKDRYYEKYLISIIKTEHPNDALTRSINEIQRWADDSKKDFDTFFVDASTNRIVSMLVNGRVSPWLVFNSSAGVIALGNFDTAQVGLTYGVIDPEYWTNKFKKHPEDVKWVKSVIKSAGFDAH